MALKEERRFNSTTIFLGCFFSWLDFSLEVGGTLHQNIIISFPGPTKNYPVKENHICLVVSEILIPINIQLLYYKD